MRVNTRHINSARGTSSNVYEDVPLVEFMYLVFTLMPVYEDVPLVEFMYHGFTLMPVYEDIPLVEFMFLVFTRMPGERYRR